MIKITFPDNNCKEFQPGITGFDIANSISPRLAKEVFSITVNGEVWDLTRPINSDATINLHKWDDKEEVQPLIEPVLISERDKQIFKWWVEDRFSVGATEENGFEEFLNIKWKYAPGGRKAYMDKTIHIQSYFEN